MVHSGLVSHREITHAGSTERDKAAMYLRYQGLARGEAAFRPRDRNLSRRPARHRLLITDRLRPETPEEDGQTLIALANRRWPCTLLVLLV